MELVKGQKVLAFSFGAWVIGAYIEKGKKNGEHFVMVDNDKRKIINNEIQYFID